MVLASDSTDPITQYEHAVANHEFVQVVYFRGHWCPFCTSYLATLSHLLPQIAAAGGKVLIVTAEPAEHLAATRKASNNYPGEAIVDPKHKLAGYLREKGLLDVAITDRAGYVKGVAQPAILVVKKDGEVLEQWAIKPSTMNFGGAKDRPDLNQVWDNVQAKLAGKSVVHKKYAKTSFTGMVWGKVFG